jgi:hypothetical protein
MCVLAFALYHLLRALTSTFLLPFLLDRYPSGRLQPCSLSVGPPPRVWSPPVAPLLSRRVVPPTERRAMHRVPARAVVGGHLDGVRCGGGAVRVSHGAACGRRVHPAVRIRPGM